MLVAPYMEDMHVDIYVHYVVSGIIIIWTLINNWPPRHGFSAFGVLKLTSANEFPPKMEEIDPLMEALYHREPS